MSVEFVDGPMVTAFVNDAKAFQKWSTDKFKSLDVDGDGVLSRDELQKRVGKLSSGELELQSRDEISAVYDAVFERFDADRSGTIYLKEFEELAKEIMLAKARGIGNSPVCVALQEDSLLMRAVQRANK